VQYTDSRKTDHFDRLFRSVTCGFVPEFVQAPHGPSGIQLKHRIPCQSITNMTVTRNNLGNATIDLQRKKMTQLGCDRRTAYFHWASKNKSQPPSSGRDLR
jgi:hypothetical protein